MKISGWMRTGIVAITVAVSALACVHADELQTAGRNTRMNFTYTSRVSDRSQDPPASRLLTYGLTTETSLGRSRLSSMLYAANLQHAASPKYELTADSAKQQNPLSGDAAGRMIVQNADLAFGKLGIKLGYQNVGRDFGGFSALRDSKAVPSDVLDRLEKEKGLQRLSMQTNLPTGNKTGLTAGLDQVKDEKGGQISTKQLSYSGKRFGISVYQRSTGEGFTRLGDLSADEKTSMALAVRRQFDANATAAQVTNKDRAAVMKEAGIDRSNIRADFKMGTGDSSLQMLNISDGSDDIKRNTISFSGKNCSITWTRQSIGRKFGKLSSLAPVERAQFGNEYGMDRSELTAAGKLGNANLGLSFSRVSDGNGSAEKQSLSVKNKTFDVKANFQNISPTFTRSMDLVDSDKKQMAAEKGYKKRDLTANIRLSNAITVENYFLRMDNSADDRNKNQLRNKITYSPTGRTKITMFRDSYSLKSSEGNISSYVHQSFSLEQKLGSLHFSGLRDTNTVQKGTGPNTTTTTTALHLESDKKKRNWFSADSKQVSLNGGGYENTRALSFLSRPMDSLTVKTSLLDISRSSGVNESLRSNSLDWKIRKDLRFTADVTRKDASNVGVTDIVAYSLVGRLANRFLGMSDLNMSASFSKESTGGKGVKKANNQLNLSARAFGGSIAWQLAQGQSGGKRTSARGIKFVSNRNPKRWLHFDVGYTVRDLGDGTSIPAQAYNLDMRIAPRTKLTANYFAYVEKPNGTVERKGGSTIKLTTALNKRLNLAAEYGTHEDYVGRLSGTKVSLGVVGTLSNGSAVELFYSVGDLSGPSGDCTDETLRVKYDRRVDEDHYLSFSGQLETHRNSNPAVADNSVFEGRLDFRTLFH